MLPGFDTLLAQSAGPPDNHCLRPRPGALSAGKAHHVAGSAGSKYPRVEGIPTAAQLLGQFGHPALERGNLVLKLKDPLDPFERDAFVGEPLHFTEHVDIPL